MFVYRVSMAFKIRINVFLHRGTVQTVRENTFICTVYTEHTYIPSVYTVYTDKNVKFSIRIDSSCEYE